MSPPHRTVAHVLPWRPAGAFVGGTEVATRRIIEVVDDGFTHIAFCRADAPAVERWFAATGSETATYQAVIPSYRRPRPFLGATMALARDLRRRRIDLVHCADVQAAYSAALAARLARLPVVCHVRNPNPLIHRRDHPFLRAVSHFVFVSHATWRRFGYTVDARRGAVVYDGIAAGSVADAEGVRAELGLPPGGALIGMVASVVPQKDHLTLARAIARVAQVHRDVRVLAIGGIETEHHARLTRELDRLGVAPYFVFTGFRPDATRLMRAMDICVLCTHFEGLPLVLIEAMAQGRPVVATAVDGVVEIVRHGETGLLHEPGDADQLAERLLALLADRALAARLGDTARRFVATMFSVERFAAGMTAIYRHTLGLAGAAAA